MSPLKLAVNPSTTCFICSNVPLDNSYQDQLTFANREEQYSYFLAKKKVELNDFTYQRLDAPVRVPINQQDILDCNYIMFQNSNFGNKWFYAFITKIEYVAPDTSWLYFEVDAWQTFYFDIQIKQCYVEREHVNDDGFGKNLIDENLATGEYVTVSRQTIDFNKMYIVVASTVTLDYMESVSGDSYNGIYSGVAYYAFDPLNRGHMTFLDRAITRLDEAGKGDAIVEMYMIPSELVPRPTTGVPIPSSRPEFNMFANVPNTATLQGYKPRNNKLLNYPYRSCVMSSMTGGSSLLKYEYFSGSPSVRYGGGIQSSSGIYCAPVNYKGVDVSYGDSVELSNYPQCSWLTSTYANWSAAQSIRYRYSMENAGVKGTINTVKGGLQGTANGLSSGNPAGIIGGALSGSLGGVFDTAMNYFDIIRGMQEEKEVHSIIPDSLRGNASSLPVIATKNYLILLEERSITADYARSIDQFFDMYGYKVNKLKQPNVTGRKYWNYVKTIGANILGNCPRPYLLTIKKMFDTGVTFWHGDYVGDYNLDNSIGGYNPPATGYFLTVIDGSGSGEYAPNQVVPITANPAEYPFKQWYTNGGGTFADPNAASTTFTMPSNSVIITATYDAPTPPEPTGQTIADYMATMEGAVEWDSTIGRIQNWYYGSYVKAAWCTTCLTYCAFQVGVQAQVPRNENVQKLYEDMRRLNPGNVWEAKIGGRLPVKGDVCFFITRQSPTVLHHCGAVVSVAADGVTVSYISGNTGNPNGGADGIFTHTTTIGKTDPSYIKYFAHVTY